MKFFNFSTILEELEQISSRNDMTEMLSKLLVGLRGSEIAKAVYMLEGRLLPNYTGVEFNFASKQIHKALLSHAEQLGLDTDQFRKSYADEGEFAYEILARTHLTDSGLTIEEMYAKLSEIAHASGTGSQAVKQEIYTDLIRAVSAVEAKFVTRIILGNLRLGISKKTILDALSFAKTNDKSWRDEIERACGVRSDLGQIAEIVLSTDTNTLKAKLEKLTILPGIPVASKLVEREKTIKEAYDRIPNALVQPKLDGLRLQIHYQSKNGAMNVWLFSRNMENMTEMFPDIVEGVRTAFRNSKITSCVLDSETVAFDEKGHMLPFQETIQRKRKYDIEAMAEGIPVKAMVFDVLYLNEEDISRETIEERLGLLKNLFGHFDTEKNSNIEILETIQISSQKELEIYFYKCLEKGLEGVIMKKPGTYYEPGTRNFDWIKIKASIESHMVDTIDGVVMGYYYGKGQRNKFGLGALLIGIFDREKDKYRTIAKLGTGITDQLFGQIKEDLVNIEVENMPENYDVAKELIPSVWVEPKIIVVVEADQVTRSKLHTAAQDKHGRGLSLRFPRMKVWNRSDKNGGENATSEEELRGMVKI